MSEEKICEIVLDEGGYTAPTEQVEQERKVAVYDLLDDNYFKPFKEQAPMTGPYKLKLHISDGRLVFEIEERDSENKHIQILSLSPFRQIIKDYFLICESYYDAVKKLPPSQIEAIDMGRRGIHDEGARLLEERLQGKIDIDHDTARRLFTLISVLHFRG